MSSALPSDRTGKTTTTKSTGKHVKRSDGVAASATNPSPFPTTNTNNNSDISSGAAIDFDSAEHELRRRLPPRYQTRQNDVYVTKRTDAKAQLARCHKLLDKGYTELYIHGLGNAVNRAINLALQLKRSGLGSIEVDVNTSTIRVTDDLIPLIDDARASAHQRNVSAVHIRIFRPDVPVNDY